MSQRSAVTLTVKIEKGALHSQSDYVTPFSAGELVLLLLNPPQLT